MNGRPSAEELAEAGQDFLKIYAELVYGLRNRMAAGNYAESLTLIAECFGKTGHDDIAQYIRRLALALWDLDYGIGDPLLDFKKDKVTSDPSIVHNGRMWVALGYECLLKAGLSHSKVAKEIARHSSLNPLLRGKNASLKTSPKSWHDQLMINEVKNTSVQRSFRWVYKALELDGNLPPERCNQLAQQCLNRASEVAEKLAV
jgi:hypothetical protein